MARGSDAAVVQTDCILPTNKLSTYTRHSDFNKRTKNKLGLVQSGKN